jgi:hypothetical protein
MLQTLVLSEYVEREKGKERPMRMHAEHGCCQNTRKEKKGDEGTGACMFVCRHSMGASMWRARNMYSLIKKLTRLICFSNIFYMLHVMELCL